MSKSCKSAKSSQTQKLAIWDPERELPRHLGFKLVPCKYCNRTFFANRIDYHQEMCRTKRLQPKRPVFDSVKSRLKGTVAEFFQFPITEEERKRPLNPDWRENRLLYVGRIASIRADAKLAKAESEKTDVRGHQLLNLSKYVQCPICGRRFDPNVAARHIPHCTNYVCPKVPSSTVTKKKSKVKVPLGPFRSSTVLKQPSKVHLLHSKFCKQQNSKCSMSGSAAQIQNPKLQDENFD